MPKTIKVRIPVAVDPFGRWYAHGYPGIQNHDELLETTDFDTIGPNEALYWLEAELTVPEAVEVTPTVTTVEQP